jgi:hypothetical protein
MSTFRTWKTGLLLVGMLLFPALSPKSQALAGDQPNVMIVGEDADEDTVPRHSRVFNRVADALRNRMIEMGFKTYNETAVTMDVTDPGRVRRTDAELLSVAKGVTDAPIDVIVPFQIYASAEDDNYSDIKRLRIRIVGRMIQIATGRDLGSFEVAVPPRALKPLPRNCNPDCVLEHLGDVAKPIANEVGTVLSRKLDGLSPSSRAAENPITKPAPVQDNARPAEAPKQAAKEGCVGLSSAYTIVLNGFDPGDIETIERMLMAFSGYEHHRPVQTRTRYTEYWYESCANRARLERNLRSLADQLGGQNRVELSGNRFEIERIPGAGSR